MVGNSCFHISLLNTHTRTRASNAGNLKRARGSLTGFLFHKISRKPLVHKQPRRNAMSFYARVHTRQYTRGVCSGAETLSVRIVYVIPDDFRGAVPFVITISAYMYLPTRSLANFSVNYCGAAPRRPESGLNILF